MSGTCKTRIVWQKLDCLNSNPDLAYWLRPSEKRMLPMSRYASVKKRGQEQPSYRERPTNGVA